MKFHDMNTFLFENHKQPKVLGIMTSITFISIDIVSKLHKQHLKNIYSIDSLAFKAFLSHT